MPAAQEIKLAKNKRSLRSIKVVIVLCLFIMISFGFLSLYGTKVFLLLHFEILPRSTKQGFFPHYLTSVQMLRVRQTLSLLLLSIQTRDMRHLE